MAGTGAFTSFGRLRLRETVAFGSVAGVDLSFLGCAGALNLLFFAPLGLPDLPGIVAFGGVFGFGGIYGFSFTML